MPKQFKLGSRNLDKMLPQHSKKYNFDIALLVQKLWQCKAGLTCLVQSFKKVRQCNNTVAQNLSEIVQDFGV